MGKEYINPQLARRLCPVVPDPVSKDGSDIVEYVRKDKVRKIGDGEDDFIVEEVVVEASRVNRQAYIMKDADQVGIMNILEKVRRSGDVTLLNQTRFVSEASGEVDSLGRPLGVVQNYEDLPDNLGDALRTLKTGSNSFAGLKEIFGDISFNDLVSMSADQVQAKLNDYVAAHQLKKEPEGGKE